MKRTNSCQILIDSIVRASENDSRLTLTSLDCQDLCDEFYRLKKKIKKLKKKVTAYENPAAKDNYCGC